MKKTRRKRKKRKKEKKEKKEKKQKKEEEKEEGKQEGEWCRLCGSEDCPKFLEDKDKQPISKGTPTDDNCFICGCRRSLHSPPNTVPPPTSPHNQKAPVSSKRNEKRRFSIPSPSHLHHKQVQPTTPPPPPQLRPVSPAHQAKVIRSKTAPHLNFDFDKEEEKQHQ
mmetsp:Transcript_22501/g.34955  ORF Transcript_22501/g.34955 Transcript_22501/m.34955 type:complete len:166 (-) Transcript_22501:101-598(-)